MKRCVAFVVIGFLLLGGGLIVRAGGKGGKKRHDAGRPKDLKIRHRVPILGERSKRRIKGKYIVVFRKGARENDLRSVLNLRVLEERGNKVERRFSTAGFKGFAGTLSPKALSLLQRNEKIAFIEADQRVKLDAVASWGLDRIDQLSPSLDGRYQPAGAFQGTGTGVHVYVIDTGIRKTHTEFSGRVALTKDFTGTGNANDCNGHGTHVAGTIGGKRYGVARGVTLYGIKVLDCNGSGTLSGVIEGINWVRNHHEKPAVANLSLGGGASNALDDAIRDLVAAGVTVAVAAGNDSKDACNASPARVAAAVTTGAIEKGDRRAAYSNYGTCVDLMAPGSTITSAWHTSDTAKNTINGTSMATPHVAGAAALYLARHKTASPEAVFDALIRNALTGKLRDLKGSPDRLLFVGSAGGAGSPPPQQSGPPCTGCLVRSGTIPGPGKDRYEPGGEYYEAKQGIHKAWLQGPGNADFDLYLFRWNKTQGWQQVARSEGEKSEEKIAFLGTSGYYFWLVHAYKGSGTYKLWIETPTGSMKK